MKNLIYLGYYFTKTNWKQFGQQLAFVSKTKNSNKFYLLADMIVSTLIRGNSFHEYYYYKFYQKDKALRDAYATMGFMYEYQRKFNPPQKRGVLLDKIKFFETYPQFIGREWIEIQEASLEAVESFLSDKEKVVLKNSLSGGGKAVKIYSTKNMAAADFVFEAKKHHFNIAEAFVYQHKALQQLSPNSLNTVRFVTQLTTDNNAEIIGAMLRMGIHKETDNLSSGGIACDIDLKTGKICSNGVTFDTTLPEFEIHPVSGLKLIGFEIPFWQEVVNMCKQAAQQNTDNKSIGWDVAITDDGPLLIEANNDWGARVWQMPAGKGLKFKLINYFLDER